MLLTLAIIGVVAFVVAWIANGLVGMLSGEKPRDTGSLWVDTVLRFFTVLELGLIGHLLNRIGFNTLPRKALLLVGTLCVLLFLIGDCRSDKNSRIQSYSAEELKEMGIKIE